MMPAPERIRILKARLANLESGSGEYSEAERTQADCANSLIGAEYEQRLTLREAN